MMFYVFWVAVIVVCTVAIHKAPLSWPGLVLYLVLVGVIIHGGFQILGRQSLDNELQKLRDWRLENSLSTEKDGENQ